MKINNINLHNYTFTQPQSFKAQEPTPTPEPTQPETPTPVTPAEMLGRSQVNFTGNNFKFSENDRKFIDVVAQNIRMTADEKEQFEDTVADFLKERKLKSMDEISGDENQKEQVEFIETIGVKLDFMSDMDFNMFADELLCRTSVEDGDYEPSPDKYRKDFEVVDYILDKYNMSEDKKTEIFDVLEMEAGHNEYDTIFDIFNVNPDRPIYLFDKYLNINPSLLSDLLIDFGYMATLDDKARHAKINPNKLTAEINMDYKDSAIAEEFIEQFNLNENADEYIKKQLQKRREGVKPEQIAFDLIEAYDLGSKEYKYILETIYNFDTNFYDEDEE